MQNQEIERKFLVKDNSFRQMAVQCHVIRQGYLCKDKERVVRIRIADDKAFLTIKAHNPHSNMSHFEFEREIDVQSAVQLLEHCLPGKIEKERYVVPYGDITVEVDVFHGDNEGLILAEIELRSEDQQFACPPFLADEVTDDLRYYNVSLSKHPYTTWKP